ncbi:MAG TPA: MG2 domain-containing protein, partial [Spirochaetota bacterium]|nr:MG2 domain-containing protein [Spirochaetota bacterium]
MKLPSLSAIAKKISTHRFIIAGGAVAMTSIAAIAMTAVLTLTADRAPGAPDVFWASHIKGHTGGEISKTSTINVIFNNNIVDKADIGKEVDGVFSFDPSLKGKAEWVSQNELVFVPEKHMPAGEKFLCTLNLDDYIKKTDGVDDFFFGFSIIEPNFDIKLGGFRFPKLENLNIQDYEGSIKTADFEDSKAIEKILEASQKGKNLEIEWKHSSETKTHNFTIKNISRGKSPSELLLKWDGSSINSDRSGEHRIEIHARDVFKVSSIEVISSSEKYVELTFTDPLKQNQNLRGLIYFEDIDSRTEIDMNIVRVFPTGDKIGDADIRVERGVLNSEGKRLNEAFHRRITFQKIDPGVRFIGDGTILPDTDNLTVPFEAVNVHSLQVTVFKVYDKNMGQFFQVNDFKQNNEIKRVGRYLWRKTIKLNATPAELSKWSRYSLDVSSLYKEHPGSLFRIELSINRSNSALGCSDNPDPAIVEPDFTNQEATIISDSSYWDYWEEYDHSEYWDNRKNPCHDAYYKQSYGNPVFSAKNFLSSNIGITAKYGSGKTLTVVTTDIVDASPTSASIKIYNFQNIEIGSGSTDGNGFADITVSGEGDPFYIVAEKRGQKGYLKLSGASQLIISHFDVGGEKVKNGLKGYIYGERGVWSPGDNIYLTFVLEDKDNLLPKDHPITMKLYDPRGRLKQIQSAYRQANNFYAFELKTDSEDETGSWTARAELGGLSFTKTLKIETVKPNRLKVELDIGGKELHRSKMPVSAKINSQWLHGATAQNLTTDVSARFSGLTTEFSRYTDYVFDDLTRTASSEKTEIFSGSLDSTGKASFNISFSDNSKPAGMLNAYFT